MGKFNGGIIHPTARYRTQSLSQTRGIYTMKEQYLHRGNNNWQTVIPVYPNDGGNRIATTLIAVSVGTADNTGDYSIYHAAFDDAIAHSVTGRIYLAVKLTASSNFHNDFCIGGVQVFFDDYSDIAQSWVFDNQSDYTAWEYATVTGMGDAADSGYEDYPDIIGATSQSWAACVNNVSNGRISRATATGSTGTGAADGFSELAWENIDNSDSTIVQESGDYFMFTEASGSNNGNKWWWVRSPEFTLDESDCDIAIAYHAASPSGTGMTDSAEEPLFRWWWA